MPQIDFQPIDFQPDFQPEAAAPPPNPDLIPIEQRTLQQASDAAPDMLKEWATQVGPLAAGGVIGKALPFLKAPLARAALSPVGQAAIGGIGGYVTGGPVGAVIGAGTGFTGGVVGKGRIHEFLSRHGLGKPDKVAQGMSSVASKPLDIDEMIAAAHAKVRAAPPVVAPKASAATSASLENELAKRIDWRTTDAVPIDAMKHAMGKGGSIIEAGESIPGLADRMAALLKQNTPTALQEAQTLAKALRQRGHITAKGMK